MEKSRFSKNPNRIEKCAFLQSVGCFENKHSISVRTEIELKQLQRGSTRIAGNRMDGSNAASG